MKKILVITGGGDCPGLNAVIRAIVKSATRNGDYQIVGGVESFNGILATPPDVLDLNEKAVAGIHIRGGTILYTSNKGDPFQWKTLKKDGTYEYTDRTHELIKRLDELKIDSIISIGGEGSQKISLELSKKGVPIVGVPKTIDNDLYSTEVTFGFQTAVQTAAEALDRLVTTGESHNRVMILEVMGRDAGWIALNVAIAGGAEVCLIPEVPYNIEVIKERIKKRFKNRRGFATIVIAEGARKVDGVSFGVTDPHTRRIKLGGISQILAEELEKTDIEADIRYTILGHIQRGGSPVAFDRVLATQFGVKAFDLVVEGKFGQMVAVQNGTITSVPLGDAVSIYKNIDLSSFIIRTARSVGISLGDAL